MEADISTCVLCGVVLFLVIRGHDNLTVRRHANLRLLVVDWVLTALAAYSVQHRSILLIRGISLNGSEEARIFNSRGITTPNDLNWTHTSLAKLVVLHVNQLVALHYLVVSTVVGGGGWSLPHGSSSLENERCRMLWLICIPIILLLHPAAAPHSSLITATVTAGAVWHRLLKHRHTIRTAATTTPSLIGLLVRMLLLML